MYSLYASPYFSKQNLSSAITKIFMRIMNSISKRYKYPNYWSIEVNNFGWQNLNGHRISYAKTGEELLRDILPETHCTFKIFKYKSELRLQNFHHDSPTGNEWYYIRHLTAKEIENEDI